MESQLRLITGSDESRAAGPSWRLSEETCQIGRRGIAMARQELRRATVAAGTAEGDDTADEASRPSAA